MFSNQKQDNTDFTNFRYDFTIYCWFYYNKLFPQYYEKESKISFVNLLEYSLMFLDLHEVHSLITLSSTMEHRDRRGNYLCRKWWANMFKSGK